MVLTLMLAAGLASTPPTPVDDLRTVAEESGYRATATHAEVLDLLQRIDARSPHMHLTEIGRSSEGRSLPLAVFARPAVATPEEARASGKPIVLAFGNIHAGEVCGKEALLMIARELGTDPAHPWLDALIVLLAPIYNADGNDRMDPENRPGQVGPEAGMGERPNAQGLDLNRDWVKLESPEARSMVALLTDWDPHLTIDTHTTNGSHHRYALTYAAPLNPSGHRASIEYVRDDLLPRVTERLRTRTGYDTFFYGNFDRGHTAWSTYSARPRFGGPYRGLRGQMSVLSEAYAYASYEDRVLVTRAFVREILMLAAEEPGRLITLHDDARRETVEAGRRPQPTDCVGLRHRLAASPDPVVIRGYETTDDAGGRPRVGETPRDYRVVHRDRFEPTLCVRRPFAYLLDPGLATVADKLRQHGIQAEPFEGMATVETYTVTRIDRAERSFQQHRLVSLEVEAGLRSATFGPGTTIVRTGQPLGTLAVYLLEPRAEDGLAAWNFFDEHLAEGGPFPVHRVRSSGDLPAAGRHTAP